MKLRQVDTEKEKKNENGKWKERSKETYKENCENSNENIRN